MLLALERKFGPLHCTSSLETSKEPFREELLILKLSPSSSSLPSSNLRPHDAWSVTSHHLKRSCQHSLKTGPIATTSTDQKLFLWGRFDQEAFCLDSFPDPSFDIVILLVHFHLSLSLVRTLTGLSQRVNIAGLLITGFAVELPQAGDKKFLGWNSRYSTPAIFSCGCSLTNR